MTLEVELVWFGCQTCSDPLLFYHLSGFSISPGSSLFQTLLGCATTNNMHVCTPVCVCESLPAVKQQAGPGSAFLIDLQVTGCVRGLIASLSAPHLPSLSSIQSLSFLSLSCPLFSLFCHPARDQEQLLSQGSNCLLDASSLTLAKQLKNCLRAWFLCDLRNFGTKKLSCSLTTCNPV